MKITILFAIAFVSIGLGYYVDKGSDSEEVTEEKVNEENVEIKEKVEEDSQ